MVFCLFVATLLIVVVVVRFTRLHLRCWLHVYIATPHTGLRLVWFTHTHTSPHTHTPLDTLLHTFTLAVYVCSFQRTAPYCVYAHLVGSARTHHCTHCARTRRYRFGLQVCGWFPHTHHTSRFHTRTNARTVHGLRFPPHVCGWFTTHLRDSAYFTYHARLPLRLGLRTHTRTHGRGLLHWFHTRLHFTGSARVHGSTSLPHTSVPPHASISATTARSLPASIRTFTPRSPHLLYHLHTHCLPPFHAYRFQHAQRVAQVTHLS